MFNFIYNAKDIKNVMFFVNNNNLAVKEKNVVVNHNKLLKAFVNFRFLLFVKVIRIGFYAIYYYIKLSLDFFFNRSNFFF